MPAKSTLDEFLTPEAMLTPGMAGAMIMMITNALGQNFHPLQSWTAWIAMALSFLFGFLAVVADKRIMVKGLFYVLNSLVIFCVASGANSVGVAAKRADVGFQIIGSAFAQPASADSGSTPSLSDDDKKRLTDQYDDLTKQYDALTQQINSARTDSTSKDAVLALVDQRDKIDAQRQGIQRQLAPRVPPNNVFGGTNSVMKTIGNFFKPWSF